MFNRFNRFKRFNAFDGIARRIKYVFSFILTSDGYLRITSDGYIRIRRR